MLRNHRSQGQSRPRQKPNAKTHGEERREASKIRSYVPIEPLNTWRKPRMITILQNKNHHLKTILQTATDLHGHFGPFLTLGVRMGLLGLKELGIKPGDPRLHAIVMLKYAAPISCILDGIQVTTKCTVGNTRLTWKESTQISVSFQLEGRKERIRIRVKPAVVQELLRRLSGQASDKITRKIGEEIASKPDSELFLSEK
jgi:formylmethanofuran dehydrogenase subunit E